MADGCLTKQSASKNRYRLMLGCKAADKEILEKFCDFVGIRRERITIGRKGATVALSFCEGAFTLSPRKYGIVPNKSHFESRLPEIFKTDENLFFQYLKGVIDGDGTIHPYRGRKGISFVSNSLSFAKDIQIELQKYIPEPTSIWITERTKQQLGRNATQSIFSFKMGSGRKSLSNTTYVYHKFYDNSKIILTRKHDLLKSISN